MSSSSDSESGKQAAAAGSKWFNSKICNCNDNCKNIRCDCYQNGRGCDNESCKCSTTCKNLFNNLQYFFGEDEQHNAHPCFALWLSTIGMSFENINRNELRDRIIHSNGFSDAIDLDWRLEDADESDELSHSQELFRLVLSTRSTEFFYSFCHNDLKPGSSYWHCNICNICKGWRTWHCEKCNQCTYGQSLPCERCGVTTDESSSDCFF